MDNTKRDNLMKASMCLAKAMEYYALVGTDDYEKVGNALKESMMTISDKLDESDQIAFANWLIKKTEAMNEMTASLR